MEEAVTVTADGSEAGPMPSTGSGRQLYCIPAEKREPLEAQVRRLQGLRNRPIFVLVTRFIDDATCREMYGWRKELRVAAERGGLDVLIHSPGGSLNACYGAARLLARYTDDWQALVPSLAASGATMICLGSSEVIMGDMTQLGPIDPQVISKRQQRFFSSERQSPLESFQAMKYLREFSLTSLDAGMAFLLEHDVNPHLALETAAKFAMDAIRPVLAKVEPYDLGSFALDSNLASAYCRRIAIPTDENKKSQRNAQYRALVEDYPAHEFIIDVDEAATLGFNVSLPAANVDDVFSDLQDELSEIHECVGVLDWTG